MSPVHYEITVKGHLDQAHWSRWFDGMRVTLKADGTTVLSGPVADQAALHGILGKVRDLGLVLISVQCGETRLEKERFLMKTVILNGMEAGDTLTESVHHMLFDALRTRGWEVEPFILHEMEIAFCAGCFGCWIRTPGQCVLKDGGHSVARAFIQSDLAVFLTPVTFGGYSSQLKKAVGHLLPNILPFFRTIRGETHHKKRYAHYPNLLVLGTLPHAEEESERIFASLVERNAINMCPQAYAAGIITQEQSDESRRETIENLLAQVEVCK